MFSPLALHHSQYDPQQAIAVLAFPATSSARIVFKTLIARHFVVMSDVVSLP
jgi:hypothetical protein